MAWRPRSSDHLLRLLLLAGVVLLAASITQCRMVTDRLVRVQADELGANNCMKECNNEAKEAREEEKELHKDRIEACKGKDDGDEDLRANPPYRREQPGPGDKDKKKSACLAAEEARHEAALKAIEARRLECVNGCHHQGGGQGGR